MWTLIEAITHQTAPNRRRGKLRGEERGKDTSASQTYFSAIAKPGLGKVNIEDTA